MKKLLSSFLFLAFVSVSAFSQQKFVTRNGQATLFSHTVAEDITATNGTVTGVINPATGEVAISVPVQGFKFEKSLMQEHFNQPNFMDSKQYPRIQLKGRITNLSGINMEKDGTYDALISGELTIKGVTKPVTEKAHVTVKNGKLAVHVKFIVKDISSYGVGKPKGKAKDNVANDIEVTYVADYEKGDA